MVHIGKNRSLWTFGPVVQVTENSVFPIARVMEEESAARKLDGKTGFVFTVTKQEGPDFLLYVN